MWADALQNFDIHTASTYGNRLLDSLGIAERCATTRDAHPALRYAQSGLLALTGRADAAPQICPAALASCADGVLAALAAITGPSHLDDIDGGALLGERAALMGLTRNGRIAAGGSCRLLEAADGWLALNLARDDDWELLPAWLETEIQKDDWDSLANTLRECPLDECIERGRLLGLAVAPAPLEPVTAPWFRCEYHTEHKARHVDASRSPLVVDLSSLWAGPLCTHLLQQLGARVIKVESSRRPDGARLGNPDFYDLLNAGKASVALDFSTAEGRAQLQKLCARADIVIEASRPRALRQLGIDAERLIDANPGLTWVSITGYGRAEPMANWVAFGDDAAVAAGLSQRFQHCHGEPVFCGDAIADPLTGLHAALAAWHSYRRGGGQLLALALRDVVAHCLAFDAAAPAVLRERAGEWRTVIERAGLLDTPLVARAPIGKARDLGADNGDFR